MTGRDGYVQIAIPTPRAVELAKMGRDLDDLKAEATDAWAFFHDGLVGSIKEQAPEQYRELAGVTD